MFWGLGLDFEHRQNEVVSSPVLFFVFTPFGIKFNRQEACRSSKLASNANAAHSYVCVKKAFGEQ